MRFVSTRDKSKVASASEAILEGISEEGGLYVPEYIPQIEGKLEEWKSLDYNSLTTEILSLYFDDFSKETLRTAIDKAYKNKFSNEENVAVNGFDKYSFLELYHGPTAAFKDMALCLLPHLMKAASSIQNDSRERIILTATSGDTGKAALEGFKDVEPYKVIVFYPENGVSAVQRQQMVSTEGDNAYVIGIDGNFDDAQTGVKELFGDKELEKALESKKMVFSSANSINIGRLIPQIVYYFYGYFRLVERGNIEFGQKIDISVPTGNFGNILAAYLSKAMGLPVDNLICASNANNVLTEFIENGVYNRKRQFHLTLAPSMDILVSSNLERYLYFVSKGNTSLVNQLMKELREKGCYELPEELRASMKDLKAACYDDESILKAIAQVYEEKNYLMDTHTVVGYLAAVKKAKHHTLIAATASPFKFTGSVVKALNIDAEGDEFTLVKALEAYTKLEAPECIKDIEQKKITQNNRCKVSEMKSVVEKLLGV